MKPDRKYQQQPKAFWASVRSLSQEIGYTAKGKLLVPDYVQMAEAFKKLELNPTVIADAEGRPTPLATLLREYFEHRAKVLTEVAEPRLMDKDRAKKVFDKLRAKIKPSRSIPMNKQKGEMAKPSYLTGIVNMIVVQNCAKLPCNLDPRKLTTVTKNG